MGSMGAVSVRKLIKETKRCSWLPDESGFSQFLSSKAKPDIRASGARVLGKADAAVRQKVP